VPTQPKSLTYCMIDGYESASTWPICHFGRKSGI